MKNLSKIIAAATFAVASLFTANTVSAQSTTPANAWRFGIGVEAGVPTGDLKDYSNFALGGTARLQYGINNSTAFTLTSGYYNFFAKTYSSTIGNVTYSQKGQDIGMVPVKAGIKAYTGSGFYVGGEVGAGFETNSGGSTKLILSPGVGYSWTNVDLGVRYENYSGQNFNYGMVAARLAYGFKL
ncbi:hypothetical protein ACFQ3S_02480 [Mucilaginibacter terrae]|uniref:hypothetical protein n=1 Tax=Mucilaginibacter terrae TaxID=1955052 RepID=UPI003626C55A